GGGRGGRVGGHVGWHRRARRAGHDKAAGIDDGEQQPPVARRLRGGDRREREAPDGRDDRAPHWEPVARAGCRANRRSQTRSSMTLSAVTRPLPSRRKTTVPSCAAENASGQIGVSCITVSGRRLTTSASPSSATVNVVSASSFV